MPMLWDGLKVLGVIAVLYALAVLFVLQEDTLTRELDAERGAQHALLGEATANFAETRASNLFTRLAVNSGLMKQSFTGALPTTPAKGGGSAAKPSTPAALQRVAGWLEQRVRVFWTVLFCTLVRLSYALLWWPFLILTLVPALVDAIAARKVQATTFALTSPQLQGFVMRALPLLLACYFLLIFLPFHEPALTVPIGIVVTSAMLWLGIVEFAKRG